MRTNLDIQMDSENGYSGKFFTENTVSIKTKNLKKPVPNPV